MPSFDLEDTSISRYRSLKPASFHDLVKFELTKDMAWDATSLTLVIELASQDAADGTLLHLTFTGVSELKYIPGLWSFAFIEVVLVDLEWDQLRYRAFESEQDTEFSLYCNGFEAEIVVQ